MRHLQTVLAVSLCLVGLSAIADTPRAPSFGSDATHSFELRIVDRDGKSEVFSAAGSIGYRRTVRFASKATNGPEGIDVTLEATPLPDGKVALVVEVNELWAKRHVQWAPTLTLSPGSTSTANAEWGHGEGRTLTVSLK